MKKATIDRYTKFVLSVHPEDKYPAQLLAILDIFDAYVLWSGITEDDCLRWLLK